jgi:WhiB family transcriptional regulator, redox-sensing transcriptional regulator
MESFDWFRYAACRGADAALFFHEDRGESYGEARMICFGCPVRVNCLDHALRTHEKLGMWGGKSPGQRKRMLAELVAS